MSAHTTVAARPRGRRHGVAKENSHRVRGTVILVLGLVFMLPVFLIVMNSFKPNGEILSNFIALPKSLYLGNFSEAMDTMRYWPSFVNSIIITALSVVITLFVSFLAAYGIAHLPKRMSNVVYMVFILGQLIPFHAVMVALSSQASDVGLNNSRLGVSLIFAGLNCSFGIMTFTGFLKSVPPELEEAAEIDGAGLIRRMFQVVFPLVRPAATTLGVLYFLWSWNDFLLPTILLGKESLRTVQMNLYVFRSATNTEWNLFIAGLTVSLIPIVLVYILTQRQIVSGMTTGAVK